MEARYDPTLFKTDSSSVETTTMKREALLNLAHEAHQYASCESILLCSTAIKAAVNPFWSFFSRKCCKQREFSFLGVVSNLNKASHCLSYNATQPSTNKSIVRSENGLHLATPSTDFPNPSFDLPYPLYLYPTATSSDKTHITSGNLLVTHNDHATR